MKYVLQSISNINLSMIESKKSNFYRCNIKFIISTTVCELWFFICSNQIIKFCKRTNRCFWKEISLWIDQIKFVFIVFYNINDLSMNSMLLYSDAVYFFKQTESFQEECLQDRQFIPSWMFEQQFGIFQWS